MLTRVQRTMVNSIDKSRGKGKRTNCVGISAISIDPGHIWSDTKSDPKICSIQCRAHLLDGARNGSNDASVGGLR